VTPLRTHDAVLELGCRISGDSRNSFTGSLGCCGHEHRIGGFLELAIGWPLLLLPASSAGWLVCDGCVRQAFVRDLLRATKLTLYVAGLALVSELDHRFSSGGLEGDSSPALYASLLSAAGTIAIGVVCHLRWKRKFAIESQLFERAEPNCTPTRSSPFESPILRS